MTAPGPQPQPRPPVIHDLTDVQQAPASDGDRIAALEALHTVGHAHAHVHPSPAPDSNTQDFDRPNNMNNAEG